MSDDKPYYECKKILDKSVFFVCELGNQLSKAMPENPVSFAEMQDSLIALAKTEDLTLPKLKHTMRAFVSKSGVPDNELIFNDAFDHAITLTNNQFGEVKKKAKRLEED